MKKVNLIRVFIVVAMVFVVTMMSCGGDKTMTLTVKEVAFYLIKGTYYLKELKMIDEQGKEITLLNKSDSLFENATVQDDLIPQGTSMTISGNEKGVLIMSVGDDTKVLFKFKVNDKIYPIGVGNGSKFVVQKTKEEKYNLLPEETAKLSLPVVEEK